MPELYFGGSFNPIHTGHLTCSAAAAIVGGFSGVALVPSGRPALKNKSEIAPAPDRLAMLRIAVSHWNGPVPMRIEPLEIDGPGESYTIDTAEALQASGIEQVNWLIGADQLLSLHRWHRYSELMQIVQFWVMARPGYAIDWLAVDPLARDLADHVLPAPAMDISATTLRDRIRRGLPVDEWLPAGVGEYIRAHSLYITQPRPFKLDV